MRYFGGIGEGRIGDKELGIREGDPELMKAVADILRTLVHVENFIAPNLKADDWLSTIGEQLKRSKSSKN